MRLLPLFALLLVSLLMSQCLVIENPHTRLAPGQWRGVLKLDPSQASRLGGSGDQVRKGAIQFEEITAGELPFLFEVRYTTADSFYLVIFNGEEEIEVRDIRYGLDRATAKDTLRVDFPLMDSYIEAVCEAGVMQGEWVVNYREQYRIPFEARHGKADRFTSLRKPAAGDISGAWAVQFEAGEATAYPALAEFRQEGHILTGTFRTETGDFRYLEGTVQANKLYLSCFDGAHAYLFEGKIMEDGSLQGLFRSGSHYVAFWEGQRDPDFRLAHPDSLIQASQPEAPVVFRFPGTDGTWVSNQDAAYAGRPLIVQILGTWCPNCLDETVFLRDYLATHPEAGIGVIGIGFERYREEDKAMDALRRYATRLELPYPLLLGGIYDKKEAAAQVPFLSGIKAYPTLVFLNKEHRVVRVHTGFDGPATSAYAEFQTAFHQFVQQLTSE